MLSVYSSIHLYFIQSIHPSIHPSIIHPFIHPSIHPFVHPFIHLSTHLSIFFFFFTVCTSAVRNCLECRHRYSPRTPTDLTPTASATNVNGVDPIQSLIGGSHPSTKVGNVNVSPYINHTSALVRLSATYSTWHICFIAVK